MIEISNLSKNFENFKAVDDISFSIPTGQIVGLLGPNGAGKSTTMRMVTGFLKPSGGHVFIDGKDIEENPVEAKKKIGYMPESAPLYGEMIVEDYLRYVSEIYGISDDKKIVQICDECGLREVMYKNISELSRGYRQRVGLAHALMNDPEILILDEPTSGLDPNQIGEVRNLIKEIGKTRTVIISTHILGEVEMICDRVIIISGGKLVADSPVNELRARYGKSLGVQIEISGCTKDEFASAMESLGCTPVSAETVNFTEKSDGTEKTQGTEPSLKAFVNLPEDKDVRPEIARLIQKNGWNLFELSLQKNSLEDIFHTLTE